MLKRLYCIFLCVLVGSLLFLSSYSVPTPHVTKEFIMKDPPFPYCHVCSIAELRDGSILAVWQAGKGERRPGTKIYSSMRDSTSGEWNPIIVAAERKDKCCMNPCLYFNGDKIFLTFHSGDIFDEHRCSTMSWKGYFTESPNGVTWNSTYKELPKDCLGCIKNKCVRLSNGEVLCPSSTESLYDWLPFWEAHFETTDTNFTSFVRRNNIRFNYAPETKEICRGIIQPTIFEIGKEGHIRALFRSGCGVVAWAESDDFGHTWPSEAKETEVPNPNSGLDGVVMVGQEDIGMVLAFNNNTRHRTPLAVATSNDGVTWEYLLDIEDDPKGSFEYPSVIQSKLNPRVMHMCYTHNVDGKRNMAYARLQWPDH